MSTWEDRIEVHKGNIGEQIVEEYLRKRGFVIYKPVVDGPHLTDRFCATVDKKHILLAEIKTKARRTHYPDTGFDVKHYNQYRAARAKYRFPVFVYFVDECTKSVYGNKLCVLEKPVTITHKGKQITYPLKQRGIIYFLQDQYIEGCPMKTICELTVEQCAELKKVSSRNYEYPQQGGLLFSPNKS